MIELPPQEPEPDVETPDDEELWVKLELETKPSLKWRGHVGTFIADQLGYDGKPWNMLRIARTEADVSSQCHINHII